VGEVGTDGYHNSDNRFCARGGLEFVLSPIAASASLVGQLRSVASGDRGLQLAHCVTTGGFGSFDPPIPTNAYQSAVPKPLSVTVNRPSPVIL